jgi:DNA-binding MarR family transcriptional regulator/GNAT superfamily N-acetyltransferase
MATPGTNGELASRVSMVRRFNRFYTKQIGVLDDGLLHSTFSLTEVRVLYELAHRRDPTATELGRALGVDPGYLSRILRGFEERGLMRKAPSASDARRSLLRLTPQGRRVFGPLDARADEEVAAMLRALSEPEQQRLVGAMTTIQSMLDPAGDGPGAPYILRPHRSGDMGWIVHRHGVLYAQEYGWDEQFESLVAEIVAGFIKRFDPRRERCWIAERDGEPLGSVFVVKESERVAKLRLLLVEPAARGLGVGSRLVDECIRFARQAGYATLTLWTNDVLVEARRIYERAGFHLVRTEPHHSFGHDLVGEYWELAL